MEMTSLFHSQINVLDDKGRFNFAWTYVAEVGLTGACK